MYLSEEHVLWPTCLQEEETAGKWLFANRSFNFPEEPLPEKEWEFRKITGEVNFHN